MTYSASKAWVTMFSPDDAHAAARVVCSIAQYGSTRSINAGVAAGIAMHAWIRQHAAAPPEPPVLDLTDTD